jgi:hypothetical protein
MMGFRPSAMPPRVADGVSKAGAACRLHQAQDTHPGPSELLFVYADGAGPVMQGTCWEGL